MYRLCSVDSSQAIQYMDFSLTSISYPLSLFDALPSPDNLENMSEEIELVFLDENNQPKPTAQLPVLDAETQELRSESPNQQPLF